MMFVEKFEPICRTVDDTIVSRGLYDTYDEANDAAVSFAASRLPEETVKAYQIVKCYINEAVPLN